MAFLLLAQPRRAAHHERNSTVYLLSVDKTLCMKSRRELTMVGSEQVEVCLLIKWRLLHLFHLFRRPCSVCIFDARCVLRSLADQHEQQ